MRAALARPCRISAADVEYRRRRSIVATAPPSRCAFGGRGVVMSGRVLAAAALAAVLACPAVASAGTAWRWPVGASVSLRYGAAWTDAAGRSCTHGGIDIPAPAGSHVRACTGGTVAFAGLVPAGAGRQAFAVTIATDDGLRATYLPLERAAVRSGDRIESGADVGELAAAGDASTPDAHLHLGVKRNTASIDPLSVLAAPAAPAPPAPVTAPRPVPVKTAPAPAPGVPAPAPLPAPAPIAVPRTPVTAPRPVASPLTAPHAAPGPLPALRLSSPPVSFSRALPVAPAAAGGAEIAAAHEAAALSLRAAHAAPPVGAVREAAVPIGPKVAAAAESAVRAKDGVAWVLVRLLVAAGAALCLRPLLAAVRGSGAAGALAPIAVRRTRA